MYWAHEGSRAESPLYKFVAGYRSGLQPSVLKPPSTWGFAPCWYRARRWRSDLCR
jgi:hypothetical protein